MKHSKEEIIKALNVIKETCEEQYLDCEQCPFSDWNTDCVFTDGDAPTAWVINNSYSWKALMLR